MASPRTVNWGNARGSRRRTIVRFEAGGALDARPRPALPADGYRNLLCRLFQTSAVRLGFAQDYTPVRPAARTPLQRRRETEATTAEPADEKYRTASVLERVRRLREGVDQAVSDGALSEASLEDWEQTALRLGAATRYRSSGPLEELATDFAELQAKLSRHQPLSTLRRLTVVTAQMAGLMSLTLLKLNHNAESRHWARTARVAADEAGDLTICSWVRAQEAYAHYYGSSLGAAVHVARQAQVVAGGRVCVGVALAAALEARAEAALGHAEETWAALHRTQAVFTELGAEAAIRSAFGYDEAQLRFHEGNAFTHLHRTDAAWQAQQRALELYPASDYMDRALIRLDRADCLAHDGDVPGAMTSATEALVGLTNSSAPDS